jgi:hypothetical protein
VVIGLRLHFAEGGEFMAWSGRARARIRRLTTSSDATAPFSIRRATSELVAEFVGSFPGIVPEQRAYPVAIEALSSLSNRWREILSLDLQLKKLGSPGELHCLHQSV